MIKLNIFHRDEVWVEKSIMRDSIRHHEACQEMLNSERDFSVGEGCTTGSMMILFLPYFFYLQHLIANKELLNLYNFSILDGSIHFYNKLVLSKTRVPFFTITS